MKIPKILSLVLVLSLIGVIMAGCSKKTVTTTTTTSEVTVGKGNVTVSITATGSMDYSDYENLSFGADGTVGVVNVKVGDLVTKGQVLATLDSDAWNTYLDSLIKAVKTAQSNLTNAQSAIVDAERQVAGKELAVQQVELDSQTVALSLQAEEDTLNNVTEVKAAQDDVDAAQSRVDAANANLLIAEGQGNAAAANFLITYLNTLNQQLVKAQQNLKDIKAGTSTSISSDLVLQIAQINLQIAKIQLQIIQSQQSIADARFAVEDANTAVDNAKLNEADAEQAVTDAQSAVDTAKAESLQITAPFDGAITTLNITQSGGAKKGATAIIIADTSKFKASLMVNETDISNISVGTMATITSTSLSNVTLNARVTAISPVATIQSGVVNYAVTATILGVAPTTRPTSTSTTNPSGQSGTTTTPSISGQSGTTTTPAITGRQRIITTTGTNGQSGTSIVPPTDFPFGDGGTPPTDLPSGGGQLSDLTPEQLALLQQRIQQGQAARQSNAAASTTVQLRQGLSLTVNLIEQQKLNVITVPNTALKTISGKTYVQVKTSGGTPEQREVTTGLKDYQNTEIVSGLTEGEVVIITKTSTIKTTTTTQAPGGFGIGGGIIR
jgi:multidrug efflux pump subunit AcrA (membrane-fusion protein)